MAFLTEAVRTEVLQIRYAQRELRMRDAYENFDALGLVDRDLVMDYSYWVIRRGDQVCLVDTGYDVDSGEWLGETEVLPPLEGLRRLGISPDEVTLLILTHFHFDHIGFVSSFPAAEIVCARLEYDYWIGKKRRNQLAGEFTTGEMLQPIEDAEASGRVRFIDQPAEIAPGVRVIPVGGHCPGEMLVTVSDGASGVLLAADAAHYALQIERRLPFFTYTDLEEMLAAFTTIETIAAESGLRIIPGHDPVVRDTYPQSPADPNISVLMDGRKEQSP